MKGTTHTRRYRAGFAVVTGVGGILVVAFALLVEQQTNQLARAQQAARAEDLLPVISGEVARIYLERKPPLALPEDPATWALLDGPLTKALSSFRGFVGLILRRPSGTVLCQVGKRGPHAASPLPPRRGGRGQVSFIEGGLIRMTAPWKPPGDPKALELILVGWFRLPGQGAAAHRVSRVLIYGVFILGVVIYLLAVLGSLLSRSQERRLNRAREKAGRLRAVGAMAAGIAHEVRNPLNAIGLRLQYLERRVRRTGESPSPEDYARIHLELGKIKKVVDGFVNFARARELTLEEVNLHELLAEVLKSFQPALEEGGIAHELRASGDVVCKVDRERIREVLQAVVANSLESMSQTGKGSLKIRVTGERKKVLVGIRDTGEVLGEGTVERIFEPYFTTRDHALGLGMTVARTLVESHGGSIEAAAVQGGGCLITVALPRSFF